MPSQNNFHCPLPYRGLSLDAGLRRRICCHEDDFQRITIEKEDDLTFDHLEQTEEIPFYCRGCFTKEKETGDSPRLEYLKKVSTEKNEYEIQFLDITFDPLCNLACLSCFPQYSHKVGQLYDKMNINYDKSTCLTQEEFKQRFTAVKNYLAKQLSPQALIVLTGGEPAINNNLKEFLTWLLEFFDTSNMSLRIFSNMTYSPHWLQPYFGKFKSLEIVISLDAVDEICHYIRYPSKWGQIESSLIELLEMSKEYDELSLNVHTVLSNLNFPHLPTLIKKLYELDHSDLFLPHITSLKSPTLFRPEHISPQIYQKTLNELKDCTQKYPSQKTELIYKTFCSLIPVEFDKLALYTHLRKIDKIRTTNFKEVGIEF